MYIYICQSLISFGSQKERLQILAFICISLYKPLICNLPAFTKIMSRNKGETAIYIYIYMGVSSLFLVPKWGGDIDRGTFKNAFTS